MVGRPISSGIMASMPYIRANLISPIDVLGFVRWVNNIVCSSLARHPLAFFDLFLIPSRMVLFETSN